MIDNESIKSKVAIYCRLSRDDGNLSESSSILNQKKIAMDYIKNEPWELFDVYIDDGYSGTNFERPEFIRMMNDVEKGLINIIIVKDLSRFGRNYIHVGMYLEEYFPSHNIRFIAINDNHDSNIDDNDYSPFKNIINEWYAKDISKKVRATLDNQAKEGIPKKTVFPIYGYMFNEKNERIPDPETSYVVKLIFNEYIKTKSTSQVISKLKEQRIYKPLYYNYLRYNYNPSKFKEVTDEKRFNWDKSTITDIIKKREYLGDYILKASYSKSFKIKKRFKNEEAYIFEKRYEPIIDEKTFYEANNILNTIKHSKMPLKDNKYHGVVICNSCKRNLTYKKDKNKYKIPSYRYYCNNHSCISTASISVKDLDEILKNEFMFFKSLILSKKQEFIDYTINYLKIKDENLNNKQITNSLEQRNKDLDEYIKKLIEMNIKGKIPESIYESMMNDYTKEKEDNEIRLKELKQDKAQIVINDYEEEAFSIIQRLEQLDIINFNTTVILPLIKKIEVKSLEIKQGNKKMKRVNIVYKVLNEMINIKEINE